MRFARTFCTSLWRARQALYEPYVPPLNEEQKKALRKVIARSMPTYHGNLNKDLKLLLQAYDTAGQTYHKRRRTLEHVNEIIQTAFGPEYSVIDRSLHNYAHDFEYAPLEFAILCYGKDNSRPRGFPLGTNGEPLPEPYNHEALARLLQRHGFTGSFVTGDAARNQPIKPEYHSKSLQPAEDRGPFPINPAWPSYTPHPTVHLTYPPVLFAEHKSGDILAFFLSPPVPTRMPLVELLRAYTSNAGYIADLITIVLLWTRSINLNELTPTCVALMVIGWLQHRKTLHSLQNPENPSHAMALADQDAGVWFRGERPIPGQVDKVTTSTWLETGFMDAQPYKLPKHIGPLLHEFLHFWSQHGDGSGFIHALHYISVREGAVKSRSETLASSVKTQQVLLEDEQKIAQGYIPSSPNEQPTMWRVQPMVIQDPFVPSFNHAQPLSRAAFDYFRWYCSLSVRTIARAHPMQTILGPGLPSPNRKVTKHLGALNRGYSSTASIGRDMKMIYEASLPPEPVVEARRRTVSRVQQAIRKRFGNEYFVECFGSTRYGVGTATSDLDLVIIDQERLDGFSPKVNLKRLPAVYDVKLVARTLYQSGFANVLAIPAATVPIVKFHDPTTGLDCDINTNDQLGLWNTRLIARYCDLVPDLVRPMIMAVKRWAKSHGMNDPSGQHGPVTFSSYALVLMVIVYLQVKGALPNLQAGLPPLSDRATDGVFWLRTKKGGHVRCDGRYTSGYGWTMRVRLDLDEALAGWFTFWGHELKYDEQLMSIREGGIVQRMKKTKRPQGPKPKPNENTTQLEEWEQQKAEEEGAIVTTFANQSESEESEDTEREHMDEMKAIAVETGSDASNDDPTDQDQHDEAVAQRQDPTSLEAVEVDADGVVAKGKEIEVPPAAKVGMLTQGAEVKAELLSGLSATEQPSEWKSHALIVGDPFIVAKNVCGNIGKGNIARFREECRRSVQLIEWGMDLDTLMGDGDPIPGPKPMRGRGGRGGRGRAGRGRGSAPEQTQAKERKQGADNGERGKGRVSRRGGLSNRGGFVGRGVPAAANRPGGIPASGEQPFPPWRRAPAQSAPRPQSATAPP